MNHIEGGIATADANATSALANAPSAAILKSLGTTAGDTLYFTGSATPVRLALGAAGTVMHGGASAPSFSQIVNADVDAAAAIDYSKLSVPSAAIAIAKLADPTTGKVIGSSGSAAAAVFPPGYEFGYTAFTSPVTVSATTEATANTLVTAPAIAFDGSTIVRIEFFAPYADPGNTTDKVITFCLYDGASSIGFLGGARNGVTAAYGPIRLAQRLTPAAATKTYSVRAFVSANNYSVGAGAGGAAAYVPGFIVITKA